MAVVLLVIILFNLFSHITCPYPPPGDEIQPGSVLLPATRRGRYLANIIRRQAVDGTGIKFNKDADRMNAESKKKVDVLSEELLPYIIAEQERRTTLYKRIMTAIQNGEKGVTIAEIRNKPPLIIRKGLLYRCPANRAPKEPDGSGSLMCEEDIEPTQVMYDSCLSAEDKELYVADNKYFFCNRHRVEGPDLPRNGSTVIGCAPIERTSLNYTTSKCALEDTEDVVVHYRYYPDRSYKYVTEIDPDREVCDHWNPCQIGYIYSLPTPDQAQFANELWKNYVEKDDEYERDEIIPPIPEDSIEEYVSLDASNYTSSPRRVNIPEGYTFSHITHMNIVSGKKDKVPENYYTVKPDPNGKFITVTITLPQWSSADTGKYSVDFAKKGAERSLLLAKFLVFEFLSLFFSSCTMPFQILEMLHGQLSNKNTVEYRCNRCRLLNLMIRGIDGNVYNVDSSKYHVKDYIDAHGKPQHKIDIELDGLRPQDFGDYFAIIQNGDGIEERLKALTILSPEKDTENAITLTLLTGSFNVGGHFDRTMKFGCKADCTLSNILCNGESILSAGRVSIIPSSQMISFNFPSFEDSYSCVYMGFFKQNGKVFRKVIAVIENSSPGVTIQKMATVNAPNDGEQFQQIVEYSCSDCAVSQVFVNGIQIEPSSRRTAGSAAFFIASNTEITIRITEYSDVYEGVYQAVFTTGSENITKTILELKGAGSPDGNEQPAEGETTVAAASEGAATGAPAEEGTKDPAATSAVPGGTGAPTEAAASEAPPSEAPAASEAPPSEAPAA